MLPQQTVAKIDISEFNRVLTKYDDLVSDLSKRQGTKTYVATPSDSLERLDRRRFNEIPAVAQQRTTDKGETWLEKEEVEDLIKWKLKHGKFRPKLTQLVASNPSSTVASTTKEAFQLHDANPSAPSSSITKLTSLKGIGPASASLLLAVFDPQHVPFFSDECFRWVMYEGSTNDKGWDRKIKYDAKEYRTLFELVANLRNRLQEESGKEISAADVEKVAYVLGKEAGGEGVNGKAIGNGVGKSSAAQISPERKVSPPVPKERKRKAPPSGGSDVATTENEQPLRRSGRRRG
ncbi:MAG: hypothetical protein M1837_005472 [Sclerophora amabilis]|nr:MAG: hypothetical protein M1837_005472 [Sclerophora amabilis]